MDLSIRLLLIVLVIAVGNNCTSKSSYQKKATIISNDSTTYIKHPDFQGVAFLKNFTLACLGENQTNCLNILNFTVEQYFLKEEINFWETETEAIFQLEKTLQKHFKETKGKLTRYEQGYIPYKKLNIPLRQYVGFKDSLGSKFIWVNVFPNSFSDLQTPDSDEYEIPRWRRAPIMIEDGGPYIFKFKYNVETQEVSDFHYNSDA